MTAAPSPLARRWHGRGRIRSGVMACAVMLLCACSLLPQVAPVALYDLGPPPAPPVGNSPTVRAQAADVAAAPWLIDSGIAYTLLFRDAHRREAYRDSRWAAPPAALVAQRLRQRLTDGCPGAVLGTGADSVKLQLSLDEFSQLFSSPTKSRVMVRLRAVVLTGNGTMRERAFVLERDAASADVAGAVHGLAAATDEILDQVIAWSAQQAPQAQCRL